MAASFINRARQQIQPRYDYWKLRTNCDPGVKKFMMAINDPYGKIFKAAYLSWKKGQDAMHEAALDISSEYGIDIETLYHAESEERRAALHGSLDWS
jgi:hypothetical protein